MIHTEKAFFPVTLMSRLLGVSRSGYYAWGKREPSQRAKTDQRLVARIRELYTKHKGRYGSPRIHDQLKKSTPQVGRNRVARLMREQGLASRWKKHHVKTTDSNHHFPVVANVLNRDFSAQAPNKKWVTDMTYIATLSGWVFLAVILDLFSRRVVGWAMSDKRDRHLALSALNMAVEHRQPAAGLIHHSDQGCEYASEDYRSALQVKGMICSMSRRGNCWDNAAMESFFGTLKAELPELDTPQSLETTKAVLFEYMEGYYNRARSHSTLGYQSPVEYEEEAARRAA